MKLIALLPFFVFFSIANAQTSVGLVAYYPLDTSLLDATGNTANNGIRNGTPSLGACGAVGNALVLDGGNDQVTFLGQVNEEFDTEDFSISFYFKAMGTAGTQYLLSKRDMNCDNADNVFFIRYAPLGNGDGTVNCVLRENSDHAVSLIYRITNEACWQHLTLVRQKNRVRLYINGEFAVEGGSLDRVDILNGGNLILGGNNCRSAIETPFNGLIDDFRVYNRPLNENEIRGLYSRPDRIATADTIIFLGNAVDIELSKTCADQFRWQPEEGVSQINAGEPTIMPPTGGTFTYSVAFMDNSNICTAQDSIIIRVIDPTELDCSRLFLPKAFTPNADGLNDLYGISNPFALQRLISFEIFDRWGNRVFFTDDPFGKWDGIYNGTEVNSGVMLYRVHFECDGEEKSQIGNFTIIK